jgi:hypothetical protein
MKSTKTDLRRKYSCLLLLWLVSANAAAGSIFDGYIPCAKEDACDNESGGFYEDQAGALDGSRVTSYGSADIQAERDLSHILLDTRSAGYFHSTYGGPNSAGRQDHDGRDGKDAGVRPNDANVQCSAAGQPLLTKICSAHGPESIR